MYAQVSLGLGLHAEAIESVTRYLTLAGRAGEHYRAALKLLDRAEREKTAAEARPAWESICDGTRGSPSCWKELDSHPNCYVWNPNASEARSVTWTGICVDGRPEGLGTLQWKGEPEGCCGHAESTGVLQGGKHTGQWVIRFDVNPALDRNAAAPFIRCVKHCLVQSAH